MFDSFYLHVTEAVDKLCAVLTLAAIKKSECGKSEPVGASELMAAATFRIAANGTFSTRMTEGEN